MQLVCAKEQNLPKELRYVRFVGVTSRAGSQFVIRIFQWKSSEKLSEVTKAIIEHADDPFDPLSGFTEITGKFIAPNGEICYELRSVDAIDVKASSYKNSLLRTLRGAVLIGNYEGTKSFLNKERPEKQC